MKVLGVKISTKRAKMIGNFWGIFEKPHSQVKTAVATFGATLETFGLLFTPTSGHTDDYDDDDYDDDL